MIYTMPKKVKPIENIILEKYHRYKEQAEIKQNKNIETESTLDNVSQEKELNHVDTNIELTDEQAADKLLSEYNKQQKTLKKLEKKQEKKKRKKLKNIDQNQVKETKCDKALSYLKLWKKHRDEWKFKKILHIWLLKNWKNTDKFPDKRFKIFLKYLHAQEKKSHAIERIKNDAQNLIENPNTSEAVRERSRSILQWLI